MTRHVLLVGFVFLVACSGQPAALSPESDLSPPGDIRGYVTPDLASLLDNQGHFMMVVQPGSDEISAEQAEALADGYLRNNVPMLLEALQNDRGGPIDLTLLTRCRQTLYAESAFERLDGAAPETLRRAYGPYWIVAFCGSHGAGDIQVSIAVSALATQVSLDSEGRIAFNGPTGNVFFTLGVPPGWSTAVGEAPERAAMRVSQRGQARVSRVPARRVVASEA